MKKHFIPVFLIIILGIIVYTNSFRNEFVYDDIGIIKENVYIKDWHNFLKIFNTDLFCLGNKTDVKYFKYYRPLQTLSNMVDYSFWKFNASGYHLTNLIWHIVNAILVYFLIYLITRLWKPSLIAGLLFVAHPIFTEAVSYVSGRADLMFTCFSLLSLILFIKYTRIPPSTRKYYYVGSVISFALALLSKEAAISMFFIIVMYDWLFARDSSPVLPKDRIMRHLSFFLVVVVYMGLRISAVGFDKVHGLETGVYLKLLAICKSLALYTSLLFFPVNLHMDRIISPVTGKAGILNPPVLISVILLMLIIFITVKSYKYSRTIFFGILWFLLSIVPVFFVVLLKAGEHVVYFPSIGIFLALAVLAAKIWEHSNVSKTKWLQKILTICFAILICIYSALTIKQNNIWKNGFTLYSNILKYSPGNSIAHNNLGVYYKTKGLGEEAIKEYNEALRLNPNYAEAHSNLAIVYGEKGLLDNAIEEFKKVLILNPDYTRASINLGNAYVQKGLPGEAVKEYRKALTINPACAEIHNNLALVYAREKLLDEALKELTIALTLKPDYVDAHNNIGEIYRVKGMFNEAIKEYKKALEINPNYKTAQQNLSKLEQNMK
ncbi:MAG: tetratricopeptide repeat protein [bacterium]|nr:tetratricopeptide repeat protein [bacterium]